MKSRDNKVHSHVLIFQLQKLSPHAQFTSKPLLSPPLIILKQFQISNKLFINVQKARSPPFNLLS